MHVLHFVSVSPQNDSIIIYIENNSNPLFILTPPPPPPPPKKNKPVVITTGYFCSMHLHNTYTHLSAVNNRQLTTGQQYSAVSFNTDSHLHTSDR